jgi:hypothetical protein
MRVAAFVLFLCTECVLTLPLMFCHTEVLNMEATGLKGTLDFLPRMNKLGESMSRAGRNEKTVVFVKLSS